MHCSSGLNFKKQEAKFNPALILEESCMSRTSSEILQTIHAGCAHYCWIKKPERQGVILDHFATWHRLSHIHAGLGLATFVTVWSWGDPFGIIQNDDCPHCWAALGAIPMHEPAPDPLFSPYIYSYDCSSSINNREPGLFSGPEST